MEIAWRAPVRDGELLALARAHGGEGDPGWWDRVRLHSLGWVTARDPDAGGELAGFVNVAWDGGGSHPPAVRALTDSRRPL